MTVADRGSPSEKELPCTGPRNTRASLEKVGPKQLVLLGSAAVAPLVVGDGGCFAAHHFQLSPPHSPQGSGSPTARAPAARVSTAPASPQRPHFPPRSAAQGALRGAALGAVVAGLRGAKKSRKHARRAGLAATATVVATKTEPASVGERAVGAVACELHLRRLFDKLDSTNSGCLGPAEVARAVEALRSEGLGSLALLSEDSDLELYAFLCRDLPDARGVPKARFVDGMRELFGVLHRLKANGFTLQQMKVVLSAGFERFDTNGDGSISLEEFEASANHLGVSLTSADAAVLYRLLLASEEAALSQEALAGKPRLAEKWSTAVERCLESFCKRKGIYDILRYGGRVQRELAKEGSVQERLERAASAACSGADEVCNAAELTVDLAGLAVGMGYLQEALAEAGGQQALEALDAGELAPFIAPVAVFALNVVRELNDLVPMKMSEDEAQLYGQVFYPRGFTQAEFRKLVHCSGFGRATAERGEVLNPAGDRRLKLVLRGSMEVRHGPASGAGLGAVLPPGSTIGETAILEARCIWTGETIRALEPVTYVYWDPERLKETLKTDTQLALRVQSLMTETMVANLRAKVQALNGQPGSQPAAALPNSVRPELSAEVEAFALLDANGDGVVSPEEFAAAFPGGSLSQGDLRTLLPSISEKLDLGDRDVDQHRLFSFFDADGDGTVSLQEFHAKVQELSDWSKLLKLSVRELETTLLRAFEKFDANGDGAISQEEFVAAAEELRLGLTRQQMVALHRYFDTDGDGSINWAEWRDGGLDDSSWKGVFEAALEDQAKRQGLQEFGHVMRQVYSTLTGPRSLDTKLALAGSRLWDNSDSLFEFAGASADLVGMGVAVSGIMREIAGVASWEDVSDIDLPPFVLFVGITAVSVLKHAAEGKVSNLSVDEAVLYATAFEPQGFSVAEFQKLMALGRAEWQELPAGALVADASDPALRIVVSGTCQKCCEVTHACTLVGRGGFLGGSGLVKADVREESRAIEPSLVVALDCEALQADLGHDDALTMKFSRMATVSLVESFLETALPASHQQE